MSETSSSASSCKSRPFQLKYLRANVIYPTSSEEIDKPPQTKWRNKVIDPQGGLYIFWVSIAAWAVLYNMWAIPLRSSFPYQTPENRTVWMCFDYIADFIYIIDILVIQPRKLFFSEGLWMNDINFTRQNYMRQRTFKLDILSVLPLDLLYIKYGQEAVYLRMPRIIKLHTFWASFDLVDKFVARPHIFRITRTMLCMMYLIHLNACAYYIISAWEGIGSNTFVYNGVGNAYIRCFYFATKTATSIGKNPIPTENIELLFMTFSWLMGIFVFAVLIGQIRDIIATTTRPLTTYRKQVNDTLAYMKRENLPEELQQKVLAWYKYTWETQRTLDQNDTLDCLPHKMKTDIAISVYIEILSKVKLFLDCDSALLRDLVLQLRSVVYVPGDTICKRGFIGNEMYIIQSGQVHVMSNDGDEVMVTLTEGCIFGEISLLGIEKMNRRTADVRSHGYSNLFVLSKADLTTALANHPRAQELLNQKAQAMINKKKERKRQNKAYDSINNPHIPEDIPEEMSEEMSHESNRVSSSLPSVGSSESVQEHMEIKTHVTVHRHMS